jgi:uncharacterized pyridoxamine 5'-phosphate oxidase family protein
MTKAVIYNFIQQHHLAVISTLSSNNKPQAALIGIAVSENLELIFDTVTTSRKYKNLIQNPDVALVIGWDNETTVQYEGRAIELNDKDDGHFKEIYFAAFKDGRQRAENWPDIAHFKITPTWIRYSNFNEPVFTVELKALF